MIVDIYLSRINKDMLRDKYKQLNQILTQKKLRKTNMSLKRFLKKILLKCSQQCFNTVINRDNIKTLTEDKYHTLILSKV